MTTTTRSVILTVKHTHTVAGVDTLEAANCGQTSKAAAAATVEAIKFVRLPWAYLSLFYFISLPRAFATLANLLHQQQQQTLTELVAKKTCARFLVEQNSLFFFFFFFFLFACFEADIKAALMSSAQKTTNCFSLLFLCVCLAYVSLQKFLSLFECEFGGAKGKKSLLAKQHIKQEEKKGTKKTRHTHNSIEFVWAKLDLLVSKEFNSLAVCVSCEAWTFSRSLTAVK